MHIINLKVLECQDFYLKFLDNITMKGEIKEKLRTLRLDAGYTQKEMAQKIKSTDKNVWAYEKGLATPPAEIIVAYAEAFNISTDYLLGLEDDFGVRTSTPMSDDITAEEKEMIKKIRTLRKESRELVEQMIDTLAGTGNSEANSKIG